MSFSRQRQPGQHGKGCRTVRFTRAVSEGIGDDSGHGRIERRKCTLYNDFSFIENASAWSSLTAIVRIEATRYIKSSRKEEKEVRLYITFSERNAKVTSKGVRSRRGIENDLHWQPDVFFRAGWNNNYLLKILMN
ncbi:MAG: hypothetical protein LBG45_09450 [Dysgonamonadaceae bacterium]|nr:hypothetical protein [Dysgonamonadaceae bacterium]